MNNFTVVKHTPKNKINKKILGTKIILSPLPKQNNKFFNLSKIKKFLLKRKQKNDVM